MLPTGGARHPTCRRGPHRGRRGDTSRREDSPRGDHLDPEAADRVLRRRDRPRRGRHRAAGRRRPRARVRPRELPGHGDARARARRHRHRVQPRGGQRRQPALRRLGARHRGRARQAHRQGRERSRRRRARRPRRQPARRAARRARPDQDGRDPAARVQGAGRRAAPAGEGAGADRHQGDRLDDPDRPRPARADHRRPLDRQDGDPHRHDPEPEGPGRDLRLRRDRPEGLDASRRSTSA